MSGKKVTVKDVARRAGVSVTTVSLVLNGKAGAIPEETRRRVRLVAEQLEYAPSYAARAMVTRSTKCIGVVVPDLCNAFFAQTVKQMQTELARYGYAVILCNSEERADNDMRYLRLLSDRSADGVIYAPSAESLLGDARAKICALVKEIGIPCLFFDRYFSEEDPVVAADNEESGYRAAKHLVENGHTKIFAVTGPLVLNSSRNRLAGLKRALAERGLSMPEEYVFAGGYDVGAGVLAGEAFLKTDATAVFAFSDVQALGFYKSVRSAGKRIPADVSVVGFDNIGYAELASPPLTTMRQPTDELAQAACRSLLGMLKGERPAPVRLPAELVVRGSVGKKI